MNGTSNNINISISSHLVDAGYRFIKIRKREKKALESGFLKDKNYTADDPELISWLEEGGNYGVLGSKNLIIVENDRDELLAGLGQLPETFTVQSGSGRGLHSYYICDADTAENLILANPSDRNDNWGNIQAAGKFVVGAGSIHPSGGTYTTVKDIPVARISFNDVKTIFGGYIRKKLVLDAAEVRRSYGNHGAIFDSVSLADVGCWPQNPSAPNDAGEVYGTHPIHGSTGGQNFFVNHRKNVFKCFRCDSGGGPLEWLAISEGLISCEQAGPGCLRGDLFKKVLEIAREKGIKIKMPKKGTPERPNILDAKPVADDWYDAAGAQAPDPDVYDAIPDVMPAEDIILIDAPPRLGKTHHVVAKWISRQSNTANVITTSHSIVEQQIRIFKEHRKPTATAVHLEGKDRCCLKKSKDEPCKLCKFYPYDDDNYLEIQKYVRDLLNEHKLLTKEVVQTATSDYCPYYIIKLAEKYADYCFTVTANLGFVSEREVTFIDEDPSIDHYFASSAELMEASFHMSMVSAVSRVEEKWPGIEKFKTYLAIHRPKGKKTIQRVIDILEQIRPILTPENMTRKQKQDVVRELADVDTHVDMPTDIDAYELIDNVKRYEMNECLSPFIEAFLFQYTKQRFLWTGSNPSTLQLVAVGDQLIRPVPSGKIIIVGSTRSEIFVKALHDTYGRSYKVVRVRRFPYSDWFAVFVVKDDNKKSTRKMLEYTLKKLSRTNEETRLPLLVLTGSEKDQSRLKKILGGIAHCSKDENQIGQKWNHKGGYINIFYQNSVISRGIDVDFYNILFIYSSDFANPYWNARLKVAKDERDLEDADYVEKVLDSIVMDETTNSMLRISPVRTTTDQFVRTVVISEHDLWKVRPNVLEGMRIIEADEAAIENLLNGDLLNERMVSLYYGNGNPEPDCGGTVPLVPLKSIGAISSSDTITQTQPDLEEFLKTFSGTVTRRETDWINSHATSDINLIEDLVRKRLQGCHVRGTRASELSIINYLKNNYPKGKQSVFVEENIARVIADLVRSGEVVRENGMGAKSMLSLRGGYVTVIENADEEFNI